MGSPSKWRGLESQISAWILRFTFDILSLSFCISLYLLSFSLSLALSHENLLKSYDIRWNTIHVLRNSLKEKNILTMKYKYQLNHSIYSEILLKSIQAPTKSLKVLKTLWIIIQLWIKPLNIRKHALKYYTNVTKNNETLRNIKKYYTHIAKTIKYIKKFVGFASAADLKDGS